jgi:hypothetical protein
MHRLFLMLLVLAPAISAEAHLGNENHTEIRVQADSMRVVLRTSIPFAWSLLGGNAPPVADEAGQLIARPLLIAAAPGLLTATAGGGPLAPTKVDCLFEVPDDVAFIYHFKRPTKWPVEVRMEFFNRLGDLDTGTIAVFDYTASRFARDVEPLAQKTLDRSNPSLSFSLGQPPVVASPKPVSQPLPPSHPRRKPDRFGQLLVYVLLVFGMAGVGWLACRRLKIH